MEQVTTFIDLLGLTRHPAPLHYAQALGLEGQPLLDQGQRMDLLSKLREGAGVTVITGPEGRLFWSLVSPEVTVRIEPDGYTLTGEERTQDVCYWSWLATGVDATTARNSAAREDSGKPYTQRAALWERQGEARVHRENLERCEAREGGPIIVAQAEVAVLGVPEALAWLRDAHDHEEPLALDWEWRIGSEAPVGLAISDATRNAYVPLAASDMEFDAEAAQQLQGGFASFLETGGIGYLHGSRADIGTQVEDAIALAHPGYNGHDTMGMAFLLGEKVLGLKALTRKYLDREVVDFPGDLIDYPVALAARYAGGGDTRNTWDLFHALKPRIEEAGQWDIYNEFERPLIPIIASMEQTGKVIDLDAVEQHRDRILAKEHEYEAYMQSKYGVDISKDTETRRWCKENVGYDPGSCAKLVLAQIDHPEVPKIIEYRKERHRRRSFLENRLAAGNTLLYVRFNQFAGEADEENRNAPATGRLSSSGDKSKASKSYGSPNLQNQPRTLRDIWTAPEGFDFAAYDNTSLEVKLGAYMSGDPNMLATEDMHQDLMDAFMELHGVELPRPSAKNFNYKSAYGGGEARGRYMAALDGIHMTKAQAHDLELIHKERYKVYHQTRERVGAQGVVDGYSTTAQGRRCYARGYIRKDRDATARARRFYANAAIQGTAALVLKKAMIDLAPVMDHYGAQICIQVHDEIDMYVPSDVNWDEFDKDVIEVMMDAAPEGMTLPVHGAHGANWDEAK